MPKRRRLGVSAFIDEEAAESGEASSDDGAESEDMQDVEGEGNGEDEGEEDEGDG